MSSWPGEVARLDDGVDEKLAIAARYPGISVVIVPKTRLADAAREATQGWGADLVMQASRAPRASEGLQDLLRPGGCMVLIGMQIEPVRLDVAAIAAKEIRIETVFRYANVFDRALAKIASGRRQAADQALTGVVAGAPVLALWPLSKNGNE